MQDELDKAMLNVLTMIRANSKSDDALKFSQAAVNLAQVMVIVTKGATTKRAGAS